MSRPIQLGGPSSQLDPREQQQFVLDDDAAESSSSQTESLLGPTHSPRTSTDLDLDLEKAERRPSRPGIVIPSREDVLASAGGPKRGLRHPKMVLGGLAMLFAGAWAVSQLLALGTRFGRAGPRISVILCISDGMGPTSETLSRSFLQFLYDSRVDDGTRSLLNTSVWSMLESGFQGKDGLESGYGTTPLDEMQIGMSRTRSSNSLITDSAAGAMAFASGIKSYNGAIGVEPSRKSPVGTVLEAAKRQGFSTGLVATSRLTHATPATFYAHVVDRDLESEIANFLVGDGPRGHVVDIALGGGACFFLPNTTANSCRTDDSDLLALAETNGFTVLRGMKALEGWHADDGHGKGGPVIGLFNDDHMNYEIDRQQITVLADEEPSLKEMTMHALQHLQNIDNKGFFLMVEGSRIDMASHNNDPAGHISDILAYHSTIAYLKKWVADANTAGTPTVLISVSDHETGGISLGRQLGSAYPEYAWYPDAIANATHSTSWLGTKVASSNTVTREWLREEIYGKGLGITDAAESEINDSYAHRTNAYRTNRILADAISRRAQIGWSTAGHSGVDVNLYASGFNSTGLAGNRENTEIGEHIAHMMGLDLDVVTLELNQNLDWFNTNRAKTKVRRVKVDHYHGDF